LSGLVASYPDDQPLQQLLVRLNAVDTGAVSVRADGA
jgi:hypothetical protein